jgi:predicted nucleic acid-binding protein
MTWPVAAVVDTGPLYAAADADDQHHRRSVAALRAPGARLYLPALVVAEASYLIGKRLGAAAEADFLASLARLNVVAPEPADWPRIAALVRQYRDLPLGGTDASVIVLAERLRTDQVITLDRRHFAVVRPAHCAALRLLPEQE